MSTILIKDSLRASVEAASGGSQTVLYTAKGQPTFMNIVKKFDVSEVLTGQTGTHPAFIVNGVEKSEIYIGTYSGSIRNGELLSLPNAAPVKATYVEYFNAAVANGAGHHMMTASEWAAVALRCIKNKFIPKGNGYYGRDIFDSTQYGRRVDRIDPLAGITTGDPRILTGSGPVSFRHNGKYNGISDLSGNAKDMLQGVRLYFGELQIIVNNNSASLRNLSDEDQMWKAIDARTGELIDPNGYGTTEFSVKFSNSIDNKNPYTLKYTGVNVSTAQASTDFPVSNKVIEVLRNLALFIPSTSDLDPNLLLGGNNINPATNNNLLSRGGHWSEGSGANIYSFRISDTRVGLSTEILGSRPAYYIP